MSAVGRAGSACVAPPAATRATAAPPEAITAGGGRGLLLLSPIATMPPEPRCPTVVAVAVGTGRPTEPTSPNKASTSSSSSWSALDLSRRESAPIFAEGKTTGAVDAATVAVEMGDPCALSEGVKEATAGVAEANIRAAVGEGVGHGMDGGRWAVDGANAGLTEAVGTASTAGCTPSGELHGRTTPCSTSVSSPCTESKKYKHEKDTALTNEYIYYHDAVSYHVIKHRGRHTEAYVQW